METIKTYNMSNNSRIKYDIGFHQIEYDTEIKMSKLPPHTER